MELNITGPATKKQRDMIYRAVDYFLDKLMSKLKYIYNYIIILLLLLLLFSVYSLLILFV